jgi:hypothetical protein
MCAVHVPVHAAVEKQRKNNEEEEDMTQYSQSDLDNDWEFKIVRSTFGAFRKPHVLQSLIEEEAQAGWEMVEKFDEYRVRFKRPRSSRMNDGMLPDYLDPYRTQYGGLGSQVTTRVIIVITLLLLLLGLAVFLFLAGK